MSDEEYARALDQELRLEAQREAEARARSRPQPQPAGRFPQHASPSPPTHRSPSPQIVYRVQQLLPGQRVVAAPEQVVKVS